MFRLLITVFAILTAMAASTAPGADALCPSDSLGSALWQDLGDGHLDQHSLYSAALIAGGVTRADELQRAESAFQQLLAVCRQRCSDTEQASRAVTVFRILHRETLTGAFCESAWQVERTIDGGPFNCVTSTILYLSLCRHLDIAASAVAQQNHVYCRLTGDAEIDVQTTCATWFDADGQPRGGQLRDLPTGQPRCISDPQLLGKIYYNRAVSLSIAKQCLPAIGHLRRAVHLDPQDTSARQNLLAAMNNGALQLSDAGQFRRAARLIVDGLALAPQHRDLLANDLYVHRQWATHLCQSGRFAEAIEVLEDRHRLRNEVDLFDAGRWSVFRWWAESLLERDRREEVHAVFAAAHRRYGDHAQLQACEDAVWSQYRDGVTQAASP